MNYDKLTDPTYEEEKVTPSSVEKHRVSVPNKQMYIYSILQFSVLTLELGALLVSSDLKLIPYWFQIAIVAHILFQEYTISLLFDRSPFAAVAEVLRFVITAALVFPALSFFPAASLPLILGITIAFGLVSSVWVLYYQREAVATNVEGLAKPAAHLKAH